MNILSIDIDFITSQYGSHVDDLVYNNDYPNRIWDFFHKTKLISKYDIKEDLINFKFIFDIFKNAIKTTNNVVFTMEHQDIINELRNTNEDLYIINIDNHHDIIYYDDDDEKIRKYDIFWCGNWVWWVYIYKNLKKYHWIGNNNSLKYNDIDQIHFHKPIIPNEYKEYTLKTLDYDVNNVNFDLIYICLSPQYTHPKHWFYFDLLKVFYEKEKNVNVELKYDHIKYRSQHLSYKNFKLQSFFENIKD